MIRTATRKDLDSVLNIERLSFGIPWSLSSFRKAFQEIFLVEDNVAGYLIAECRQRNCYMATIKRLAVHPEQRGSGIGKKLLDTKHPAFKTVTAIKGRIVSYWKAMSLPYPEPGVRQIELLGHGGPVCGLPRAEP